MAGPAVRVVAPDGLVDSTARVVCLEPSSEPLALDAAGQATLPVGCARAQCTSRRWLAGDVVEGTCTLAPAVVLEIAMPAAAHGEFAVRLEPKGGRAAPIDATIKLAAGSPRSAVLLPPVAPGGYVLSVRRAGSAWTCSSEPLARQPERLRVIVPWRDAVIQRGRLRNARGEPLPQVPVEARLPWNGEFRSTGSWACASVPAAPASSTAGGAFELPVDPDVETMILAGGWDHPKGIAARFRRGAAAEPMSLVVKPAYRLGARVLDDKDVPLACRTEISTTDTLDQIVAFTVPGSARKGTCGPDGKIRLGPLLHPGYELAVYPEEALPARRRDTADRPVTDLGVIRVDRGGSLSVEVHNTEGNPVSGAEVSANNRQGEIVKRTARTAAAGLVTLRGLPRDTPIDVRVRAKDYATHDKPGVEADGARVTVVLTKGGTLRGRVLTPEAGVPRHGTITWKLEGDKPPRVDALAEDGTFVIDPPPGPVDVHASAPGFASSVPVRVDIPADRAPPDLQLTLRERDLLRGRVVDPDGRPMSGATVLLLTWRSFGDPPENGSQASAISGADGEFTLPEPDTGQGVAALLKGYAPGMVEYAPEMRDRVELKLGRPAALRIKLPDALAENGRLQLRDGANVGRGVFARSRTDFVVEDLWPPRVQVTLANGPEKVVELVAGETAVADFRSVGRVLGRVMYKGRAIARAAVINLQQTPRGEVFSSTTLTDDDGRFELESVAAGRQRIIAHAAEGRADAQVTIPEGGDLSLDLELSDARLDLLVTDAKTGAPVSGAKIVGKIPGAACWGVGHVRLSAEQGGFFISYTQAGCLEAETSVDGTASLAVPNPGAYDLSVRAQDYEPWTAKMKLGQDIVPVRAEMVRGSLPRVRVTLESDPPGVEGLFYCGQGVKRTQTAAKAEGVCEGFDPGAIVIAFRASGYGFARATVTVPERGDVEVTLKIPRGGDLVIPVPGKDAGVGVLDARGEVINMWGRQDYPECDYLTDAEGKVSYVCRVLPPGNYKIMTYGQHRGAAVVRPGETTVFY